MASSRPGWERERRAWENGRPVVAGCDEAGRGPLAGPVVAAAVILSDQRPIDGLDDSKKLSVAKRLELYAEVRRRAVAVALGMATAAEIDRHNILQASLLAMRRAVAQLGRPIDYLLVDGNRRVPGLAVAQEAVVKGDQLSVSIAAASIVAKVTRDAIMERLDRLYPGYGFAGNKGYPSRGHVAALRSLGACPVHRASYAPVRAVMPAPPPLPPARCRGATPRQLMLFEDDDLEPGSPA